jgi:acyl-CoA thioesterase
VDAVLAAAMTDAFVPAVFKRPNSSVSGPVPTIDLTIHFRADLPLPDAAPEDFYAAAFRSTTARDGFVEEDGELWSANGVLIAQSRQLAIMGS